MEMTNAIRRLSALAQDTRLQIFKLLVNTGPEGLAAGEIGRRLDIPAPTLSAHLLVLSNAPLVQARREGRSIIYSADYGAMRELLAYLTQDCCGGRADLCAPLDQLVSNAYGAPATEQVRSRQVRRRRQT